MKVKHPSDELLALIDEAYDVSPKVVEAKLNNSSIFSGAGMGKAAAIGAAAVKNWQSKGNQQMESMNSRNDLDCEKAQAMKKEAELIDRLKIRAYESGPTQPSMNTACGTANDRKATLAEEVEWVRSALNSKMLDCANRISELSALKEYLRWEEHRIPEAVKETLRKLIYNQAY